MPHLNRPLSSVMTLLLGAMTVSAQVAPVSVPNGAGSGRSSTIRVAARPSAAVAAPGQASSAQTPRAQSSAARRAAAVRAALGLGGSINPSTYSPLSAQASALGVSFIRTVASPADVEFGFIPGIGGTNLLVGIFVESTMQQEIFTLHVPDSAPGVKRPLLMAFHGFGVSHLDIAFNTSLLQEAADRDWFLVAPFQFSDVGDAQVSYSSVQSQVQVEAVMSWIMDRWPVDRDRIYGAGFSMGGGNAANYAARHRDRRQGAFAAVVNHTGSVSVADVYKNQLNIQGELDLIFGGSPLVFPFEYQRSSVIELDGMGTLMPGGRNLAVNLEHVPTQSWYGIEDPLTYLVDQTIQLDAFMQLLPNADHMLMPTTVTQECLLGPALGHCWETLDAQMACDWLELQTLENAPLEGEYLIDRDGRWGVFDVVCEQPGQFSSFEYSFLPAFGRARIEATDNIAEISLDLSRVGLDTTQAVEVTLGSNDASLDRLILRGMASAPQLVRRDGQTIVEDCSGMGITPGWCYDAASQTVTIFDAPSVPAVWLVRP